MKENEEIKIDEEVQEEKDSNELINDEIIDEGESFGMVDNDEEFLAFSIDGLYSDKKETKYKNSLLLRKSPPIMEISSSNGDKVKVPLTYNFLKSLLRVLNDVNFAYLGMKKTKNKFNMGNTSGGVFSKVKDVFSANKLAVAQLFIGLFLGISLSNNMIWGILASILLSIVALLLHYSDKNNEELDS